MIRRPDAVGAFWFATLAAQRAAQLMRGCTPRVDGGGHKPTFVAQLEVAEGMVGEAEVVSPGWGEAQNALDRLAPLEPPVPARQL